ncbi:MAG: hypothetical protein HUU57_14325 [Bdellovibrio sp.]|nr:hypothetical protein [Bdellovibrio sp.]
MDEMLQHIAELKPFVTSPTKYAAPENSPEINSVLTKMVALSAKIKHDDKVKSTALQVPATAFETQLQDAQRVFNSGNKSYSLWMLRSSLSNCISCHTQMPAQSTSFAIRNKDQNLVNLFQEAEFLFIVRNFDKALEFYNKIIGEFPSNKALVQDVETAVIRKIFYYTRISRNLKDLAKSLDNDLKNKNLLPATVAIIKGYKEAANTIAQEPVPAMTTDAATRTYAEKILRKELAGGLSYEDSRQNLRNLRLSGFLYEYLDKHPETNLKPDIYYWLSFCESRWERGLQDSLPELYLKKCVTEFPSNPVAKKCFKEFKDLMIIGYSGSGGTNIPADVSAEMEKMQTLIETRNGK